MAFDGRLLAGMSVLAAIVEGGSYTRAGGLLGLSASGVSRALSRLEVRIGVRLLDRTTRALRLTAEGARLYELAAPHLEGIAEAATITSGTAGVVSGVLRVSVNSIFARHVLAPRLPDFLTRFPALSLTMVQHPDAGDLVSEAFDAAIRFGPQPPSRVSSRLLLRTRVLTVAAPAYLERHGRPAAPADLAGHQCLQFIDPNRGRRFDWEFRRGGEKVPVETTGPLTFTDVDTMVTACVAGAGVAQMLALGAAPLLATGALVELFPDWPDETFPLYAIRPSRRLPPAKVEAFLHFCEEIARSIVPVV